jgi:uncharacterized protein YdiU (UPF0061 family)
LKTILFNNHYIKLGAEFYTTTHPSPTVKPEMIIFNGELARELGLSAATLNPQDGAAIFSGNHIPEGAEPLAMAYSGHQFGHFTQLGDGRAILLGEIEAPDGRSFGVQLKGSGRTSYSRNGDGRSALGPVLREYLVSEAMAKLGVPTTRALAAVTTGEEVVRQHYSPGGIITRIASSFVRVGTFQYFAASGNVDATRKLADHVIEHNYPQLREAARPYVALLEAVVDRQAALIARWMQFGFIHGVMNTDNMSVAGETIDYGPCAFMDAYADNQVFSSIDHQGRYAYNNQPSIGLWNLTRLAETLLPLLAEKEEEAAEIAKDLLEGYIVCYQQYWLEGMRGKIGLSTEMEGDKALVEELFNVMAANDADFTLTFSNLSRLGVESVVADKQMRSLFVEPDKFSDWAVKWCERLRKEQSDDEARQRRMQAVNPHYIPRNHQIEAAIRAAEDRGDFSLFHGLHEVLQTPYTQQEGKEAYTLPPKPHEIVTQTFCGT